MQSIKVSSYARIIQLDQSEYVPERALLKDQFSCCIQWSYTLTQRQPPDDKKTNNNIQDDKTVKLMLKNFDQVRLAAVVAEQRIKNIVDNENQ